MSRIAVIGGGIQGVCAALALAREGNRVTIFEAAGSLLDRASFRSEGKIHLGFVYANDCAGGTAELMLDAAMHFGPLLEKWIGPIGWERMRSSPFVYVRMPDSLLSEDALLEHYARIDRLYRERYRGAGHHYLGARLDSLLLQKRDLTGVAPAEGTVIAATNECALDRTKMRDLLRNSLAAVAGIAVRTGHRVLDIARLPVGFRVEAETLDGSISRTEWDIVVNCSWTDRLRLDRQLGLEPDRQWLYRLKFRLTGHLSGAFERLRSSTFVLGPYGDFVSYPGDHVYLSWYPVSLERSEDLTPPSSWDPACRSALDVEKETEVKRAILRRFREILPELSQVQVDDVGGGVIFAWGSRDIDDPSSELHSRREIGVEEVNGYFTINTGKFTCAPLFAKHLVDRVREHAGQRLVRQ